MINAEAMPQSETLASRAARLFTEFRDGDESRMGELIALLTPILWHTVRAQRVDPAQAEDVLQTTWLALVRNAYSIADPRAVLQWLVTTARREAWRLTRRQDRVESRDLDPDEFVASPDDAPEQVVLSDVASHRLWQHIQQLPERCRQLLRVIAFGDRPDYTAIAQALGMPVGSIGPTRGRCLARLRLRLTNDPAWEA